MENCTFHSKFSNITCNTDNFTDFNDLNRQEQTTLLSEIGLLFTDTNLHYRSSICTNHLLYLQDVQRKRQRKKTCEIPDFFNDHSLKTGPRNKRTAISADRYLSLPQVIQIQQRTGHVLPIGTPICRNCRRKLLSMGPQEHQEINEALICKTDSNNYNVMNDSLKFNNTTETADKWCIQERRSSNTDRFLKDNHAYLTDEEESHISVSSTQGSSYHPYSQEIATDSQTSIESETESPLKLLNNYLQTVDVSPVHKIRGHLSEAGDRTKRRYISKAKQCIMAMLNTICPEEGEELLKNITSNSEQIEDDLVEEAIICAYNKAESWTLQRQLLSILASKKSFYQIKSAIPTISNWRYRLAREHALKHGAGNPVPNDKRFRQSIDPSRIESFLDFITSSDVIKDLPFGEKTMKLSSGETIQTPNVIRCIAPAAIVRQYDQYCEENDIVKIGHSTMFKILQVCPASIQKSVEGIDYFVVEGSRAFEDLIWIAKQIYTTREEEEAVIKAVNDCKQYIKHDFKIHLDEKSEIKDHCIHFALNDKDKKFRIDCTDHQHTNGCPNCQQLTEVLDKIEAKVEEMKDELADDLFDEVKFKTSKAISDIIDWRKHLVRSKNQMRAKTKEISLLSESRAIIIADWAMKFLPRKFREGQPDWYAKRGINWHIGVAITRSGESLQALTFVHIFTGQTAQDAHTSALVLCDIAMDVQTLRPNINQISFYSDNAGCYKSTLTLAMLHAKVGQLVTSYNFSEAQDGKGPCDRKASHIKAEIKRYVNEGHNVLEAEDMKKAIDSRGNYRCKVVSFESDSKPKIKSIPGITSYSNFTFTDEGITVWKAFEIGQGKCIPWNQIYKETEAMTSSLKIHQASKDVTFAEMRSSVKKDPEESNEHGGHEQNTEIEEIDETQDETSPHENEIFCCPVEGCIKTFIRHSNLEEHVLVGNCSFKVKRESTLDTTKKNYKVKVTNKVDKMYSISSEIVEAKDNVSEGWALKSRKPHTMLSNNQKEYLVEKFDVGIKTGKKEDPASVANDMRRARKNGNKRFKMDEYLTTQQIASFFSREAKKRTEQTIAAKLETNLNNVQRQIILELEN